MKEFFTIGEVSKLFGINKKTLRYYDEIDLFKPSFVNKDNKYRYYTLNQFQYLETIRYLKELGLSLDKIKYHLNNANSEEVINSLEEQNDIINKKISELELIKHKINNKIIQIKDSKRKDIIGVIREVDFKERQAVHLRHSIKTDEDIELSLRKLTHMSGNKIFLTYGMVGVSISREDLMKRVYDEYKSIFVMIEEKKYDKRLIKIFPKGTYICIRFNGTHKDSPLYYEKLMNYINDNQYDILGESLEIELTDPSLLLSDKEVVMELQILVEKHH